MVLFGKIAGTIEESVLASQSEWSTQCKSYKTGSIYTWIRDLTTSTFCVADAIKDAMLHSEIWQLRFPPIAWI